jgi:hypothetical protein
MREAVLHVCPDCGRVFSSPSVCSSGVETEARTMTVTNVQAEELARDTE